MVKKPTRSSYVPYFDELKFQLGQIELPNDENYDDDYDEPCEDDDYDRDFVSTFTGLLSPDGNKIYRLRKRNLVGFDLKVKT
jgi:hypothetical protein